MQAQKLSAFTLAALLVSGCTMNDQSAPPLTGPSEFGTSVTIQVTPDVLQQDGASQSVVTVTVRDANGKPVAGVPLRAEIRVDGQAVDFGTLSARSIVTNGDGRATLVYTAPTVLAPVESLVDINVTPIGTDYANAVARNVTIRLVPTGVVLPPSGLVPAFTFSPTAPQQGQGVFFDAGTSTAPSTNPITEYRWDFNDGRTATGRTTQHAFSTAGTYFVRLTVSDALGRAATTTQSVTVAQGAAPTADFAFSPTNPQPNDEVRFNAAASTAAAGRTIVRYVWDLGDGTTATGQQVTRRYTQARTYNVTLTVTDDIGRTSTVTKGVTIAVPEEEDKQ